MKIEMDLFQRGLVPDSVAYVLFYLKMTKKIIGLNEVVLRIINLYDLSPNFLSIQLVFTDISYTSYCTVYYKKSIVYGGYFYHRLVLYKFT